MLIKKTKTQPTAKICQQYLEELGWNKKKDKVKNN